MAFKRSISVLLTALVFFLVCAPMLSKMSCLKSGMVITAVGHLQDCCPSRSQSDQAAFQDVCCEFSTLATDAEMLSSERATFNWTFTALPIALLNVDRSILPSLSLAVEQVRGPPTDLATFLAKICTYRL